MRFLLRVLIVAALANNYSFADVTAPGHLYTKWIKAKEIKKLETNDLSYHCKKIKCYKYNESYDYVIAEEEVYKDEKLSEKVGKIVSVYSPVAMRKDLSGLPPVIVEGCTSTIAAPDNIRHYDGFVRVFSTDADNYYNRFSGDNNLCNQYFFDGKNYHLIDINGLNALGTKSYLKVKLPQLSIGDVYLKNPDDQSSLDFLGYDQGLFIRYPYSIEISWPFYNSFEEDNILKTTSNRVEKSFEEKIYGYLKSKGSYKDYKGLDIAGNSPVVWVRPEPKGVRFIDITTFLAQLLLDESAVKLLKASKESGDICSPNKKITGEGVLNFNFVVSCRLVQAKVRDAFISWGELNEINDENPLPKLVGYTKYSVDKINDNSRLNHMKDTYGYKLPVNIQIYPIEGLNFIQKYVKGEVQSPLTVPKEFISTCIEELDGAKYSCDIVKVIKYIESDEYE